LPLPVGTLPNKNSIIIALAAASLLVSYYNFNMVFSGFVCVLFGLKMPNGLYYFIPEVPKQQSLLFVLCQEKALTAQW
jgi:hypothetical protein